MPLPGLIGGRAQPRRGGRDACAPPAWTVAHDRARRPDKWAPVERSAGEMVRRSMGRYGRPPCAWTRCCGRRPRLPGASCPPTRASPCARGSRWAGRRRPAARGRELLREVHRLPRREGLGSAAGRPRCRPPPWPRGEPARSGKWHEPDLVDLVGKMEPCPSSVDHPRRRPRGHGRRRSSANHHGGQGLGDAAGLPVHRWRGTGPTGPARPRPVDPAVVPGRPLVISPMCSPTRPTAAACPTSRSTSAPASGSVRRCAPSAFRSGAGTVQEQPDPARVLAHGGDQIDRGRPSTADRRVLVG